jgi:RsiW-degrading membrane proteinase PrsW (M82 family)
MQAVFQAEWTPLLSHALVAAEEGCMTCIAYLQKDGCELGEALDIERMRNSTIYVRGC